MAEAIARASKIEGLSYVTLSVVTTNEAAIRLYESLGFETYGTEIDALRVGDLLLDEHLMSLALPANGSIPVN
jgi:RimJ/RimL family protein N-acetyltransferase